MKYIVSSYEYVKTSIPETWEDAALLHPASITAPLNTKDNQYFVANDAAYEAVYKHMGEDGDPPLSKELAELTIDKFAARSQLKSMQDIPFSLSSNNIVDWPHDPNENLIAKPVHGTASRNVVKTKHGGSLPDIGEDYIIEKYIDDCYQRVSVDGYVCGDIIEILSTCDNMYYKDEPTKFHYLGHPSVFHNDEKLKEKYVEVVKELKEVTGCNNQLIDVEFFAVDGEFLTMEINPRILANSIPIYEKITGINPWIFMDGLRKGVVYEANDPPQSGVVRYNYVYGSDASHIHIQHDESTFSSISERYSHTYRTSEEGTPHADMIRALDDEFPSETILSGQD